MKKVFLLLISLLVICGSESAAAKKKEKEVKSNIETKYGNALLLAYSPINSTYEDDNIILQIYNGNLYAKNKTDKTIFIDLSQCFLINNGSSYPMYTEATDEKKASKAKKSTSIDEFISIAPATGNNQNETYLATLDTRTYGKYSSIESPSENFSEYDKRMLNLIDEMAAESLQADPNGKEYLGTSKRHLTEEESISNIGASIAYAFNKRSEDWTNVTISTWVADIILTPYYNEFPKKLSKDEKQGFGIKETEAVKIHVKTDSPFEFEEDRSPIIVASWDPNVKKGYFNLGKVVLGPYNYKTKERDPLKLRLSFDGENADWGDMKYVECNIDNIWGRGAELLNTRIQKIK